MPKYATFRFPLAFDTNVWSYLADRNEIARLKEVASTRNWEIVIPPCILLEISQTPPALRRKFVQAITEPEWSHLLPEIGMQTTELISEIRRLRPTWLRRRNGRHSRSVLQRAWKETFWKNARRDPDSLASSHARTKSIPHEHIISLQKQKKAEANAKPELMKAMNSLSPVQLPHRWKGRKPLLFQDLWRYHIAHRYWVYLTDLPFRDSSEGGDTTILDWVSPSVDVTAMFESWPSYLEFWYTEAVANRLARNWISTEILFEQLKSKIASGTPGDSQLISHLFDFDIFVSSDKYYIAAIERLRPKSPRPFAQAILFNPRADSCVDELVRIIPDIRHFHN